MQHNVTIITGHGNYMNAFRDAILTGASLCNGRIRFSAGAKVFDQPAGLGDRAGREPGTRIDIAVRSEVAIADSRRISGTHIVARESFASRFRSIRAQERAILRVIRLGQPRSQLEYHGRQAGNPGRNP